MSVSRIWSWSCDHPGGEAAVRQEEYGRPPGWAWVHERGGTTHRCPEHVADLFGGVEYGLSGQRQGLRAGASKDGQR